METLSVQAGIREEPNILLNSSSDFSFDLSFIEKEVDMGYSDYHSFKVVDGTVIKCSCQRINHCSCNCNKCSTMLF